MWRPVRTALAAIALTAVVLHGAGAEETEEGNPFLIPLGVLTVPIYAGQRVRGQAVIDVALAIDDLERRRAALALMPRMRDALFVSLYRYSELGNLRNDRLDLDRISERLQGVANTVLGGNVGRILIQHARLSRGRR